jgi:RNA recognition motif-containing protein
MTKLYVGNLSFETTDDDLLQLFNGNGFQVASARVITDRDTGRSRGFAFVEMGPNDDAGKAIGLLNGFNLQGRNILVNEARPQTQRSGAGGGGRGGFGRGGGGGRGRGGGRDRY